ncbi:MAG: zinc transport system substrate-binding protein [Methanofollis sp.]|nr:zinc transport system substrate-binding protein [Methanofollis sp.]
MMQWLLPAAGLFCIVLMAGCLGDDAIPADDGRISVAVTIPPQEEFVREIGGDKVDVMVLVPPGASPHTYELTPGQLTALGSVRMYAAVGSGIEFERAWMDKIVGVNPGMLLVNCSAGLTFLTGDEDEEGGTDPHVWLSVRNAEVMVENICAGLVEIDPDDAAYFEANRDRYLDDLRTLDTGIAASLEDRKGERIMVYHPSWAYFARDYGLVQIPIEDEGKEPGPQGIERLIMQAEADNITVVFASPEYSTKSARVIADAIGGRVALVSPLEANYTENMKHVAAAFGGAA